MVFTIVYRLCFQETFQIDQSLNFNINEHCSFHAKYEAANIMHKD